MAEPGDFTFRERWWKRVRADREVVGDLLAAAMVISSEARRDGTRALISHRQLAEDLGVSERMAQRHTKALRDLGYLELVERGGRRGVTVTANVYDLSQRVTQMTQWDSQHDTQVSPWDAGSLPADDVLTRQNDVPTRHPGVVPHFTSPLYSPQVKRPTASAAGARTYKNDWRAKDLELFRAVIAQENDELIFIAPRIYEAIAATGKDWPGKYIDGIAERGGSGVSEYLASLGFDQWAGDDVNQDQKQEHLKEEPRCQVADCRQPETNHHLWMAMLDPDRRHPFVKASS